ncbi:unnamed protein product [Spirodela intermedia]|uniref:J domain-containing protein n=1 Tax=Spirodela intermedia TaxID=51605 RepID=A0A7I8L946_SPIIN|nr:unnamed protein product [Spirodela intermedia]
MVETAAEVQGGESARLPAGPEITKVGHQSPSLATLETPAEDPPSAASSIPLEAEIRSPIASPPSSPRVSEEEAEALRLKSLAEDRYRSGGPLRSALKYAKKAIRLAPDLDGLPQMVTALRVLRAPPGDHYRALLIEPFSHVNVVRRQYKALALILHPDKNTASLSTFPGSEEAFKRIGEAFQVLSDRGCRREYDIRLRMELEASARSREEEGAAAASSRIETFWTACTTCRLFHQFDRRYVGQRLLCPRCRKSFMAVEVSIDGNEKGHNHGGGGAIPSSNTRVTRTRSARLAGESMSPALLSVPSVSRAARSLRPSRSSRPTSIPRVQVKQEISGGRKRTVAFAGSLEESKPKRAKEKTLAEIQMEIRRKSRTTHSLSKAKGKKGKMGSLTPFKTRARDLRAMAVEDSDFYDFDKHRTEKSFRKGQIWAIYDDDDGMPRHYGLIEEVYSTNPFRVLMSWLDIQNNGDKAPLLWEKKTGLHISSGLFKVGKEVEIDSVNLFSHQVDCERAARELYRIYPRKGSVWALYREGGPTGGGEGRDYDLVVLLSSFSEMYGLTMAYLEKLEGFKTIFKRREVGIHAVKWLERSETQLFSHQIPARKLSDTEMQDLPGECWELDPASLPSDLLQIGWKG